MGSSESKKDSDSTGHVNINNSMEKNVGNDGMTEIKIYIMVTMFGVLILLALKLYFMNKRRVLKQANPA